MGLFTRKDREAVGTAAAVFALLAMIFAFFTVGCCAKNFDPCSPFPSPVTATKSTGRRNRTSRSFSIRAISSSDATPEASSIAPL